MLPGQQQIALDALSPSAIAKVLPIDPNAKVCLSLRSSYEVDFGQLLDVRGEGGAIGKRKQRTYTHGPRHVQLR